MRKDGRAPDTDHDEDDGAAAFAEAVRGARKLGGARRISPTLDPGSRAPALPSARPSSSAPAAVCFEMEETGEVWTARADGVDRRVVRKLRAGEIPIEAEVDLHGLTRLKAADALNRFLTASRAAHRRCLLIIHGRGLHSGPDGPALRDVVRDRLTAGAHAGAVLACGSAPAASGGPGATIVFLRR